MNTKKRREKRKDFFHYLKFVIAVLLVVLILILTVYGYHFGKALFTDTGMKAPGSGTEYLLNVAPGEGIFSVGRDLQENRVIESALVFAVQSKLFKCVVDPGTYRVNSSWSSKAILKELNLQHEKNRKGSGKK